MDEPMRGLHAGLAWQMGPEFTRRAVNTLRLKSWYNWRFDGTIKMAWSVDEESKVAYRNDSFWLLYNEPEARAQANTGPCTAAHRIHEFAELSGKDKVAFPGVLIGDQGFAWLNSFLDCIPFVPDYWHFHLYAHNVNHLADLWIKLKKWMAGKNELGKDITRPVIISEFASWDHSALVQMSIMNEGIKLMHEDPLAHSIYWFSGHSGSFNQWWWRSDLLTREGTPTVIGRHFIKVTEKKNLFIPLVQGGINA